MKRHIPYSLLIGMAVTVRMAAADPTLCMVDSNGNLATVDVQSGTLTIIGSMPILLTDIASGPNGDLYGFDVKNIYRINSTSAALTLIGPHGIPGANALGFAPDGALYAAGQLSTSLYRIDPLTGLAVAVGDIGFSSAGDLTFHADQLYMSSQQDQLILIDQSTYSGTAVGNLGVRNMFGLATAANGILYGVAGTAIFSVNPLTGEASETVDFRGQRFGEGWGATVVPEPSTFGLLLVGGGFVFLTLSATGRRVASKCVDEAWASRSAGAQAAVEHRRV